MLQQCCSQRVPRVRRRSSHGTIYRRCEPKLFNPLTCYSRCTFPSARPVNRCKRAPYHYTAKCEEVVAFGREWSSWLTEGKATFLKAMAAQDGEHKALLDQHNSRKKEHDRAVEEVR